MVEENKQVDFQLSVQDGGLTYTPANIIFSDYERILADAEKLNMLLNQVQVTEDNLQLAKKLVAETRKQFNILDQQRKDIKKFILEDYQDFEKQVKEIGSVISEGENLVRGKIRELEEIEREEKWDKVFELWEEHSGRYEFTSWIGFDDWYEPRYTNKSQSLSKTEEELIEWLEEKRNDVLVIDASPDREELMFHYRDSLNLSDAILKVNQQKEAVKNFEQTKRVKDKVEKSKKVYRVTVYSEGDYHNLLSWLRCNQIEFTKEVI